MTDHDEQLEHKHGDNCKTVMAIRNTTIDEGVNIFDTYVAQAAREARREELEYKYTLHVPLLSSKYYKDGFSAALDQLDASIKIRLAQLDSEQGGAGNE